jgi:hypothetical protein
MEDGIGRQLDMFEQLGDVARDLAEGLRRPQVLRVVTPPSRIRRKARRLSRRKLLWLLPQS